MKFFTDSDTALTLRARSVLQTEVGSKLSSTKVSRQQLWNKNSFFSK